MNRSKSLYDACPAVQAPRNGNMMHVTVMARLRNGGDSQRGMEQILRSTAEYILLRGKRDGSYEGLLNTVDVMAVGAIGEDELLNLVSSIPKERRQNAVFMMNFETLSRLYDTLKNSAICRLSADWKGQFHIMNTPVMLCSAMPCMDKGNVPVLYGDFSGVRIEDGGHDGVQTEQGMGNNSAAVCTLRGYFRCSLIDRDAVRGLKII